MGTHVYVLEVKKNLKKLPWNSLDFEITNMDATGNMDDFMVEKGDYTFISTQTCRESILEDLQLLFYWYFDSPELVENYLDISSKLFRKFHYLVGIRSYGEMYTKVAKILRRNGGLRKLERFYREIFHLNFKLEICIKPIINLHPVPYKDKFLLYLSEDGYTTRKKYINGSISIKFLMEKNGDVALHATISALLALLREPLITERILSGKITDRKSLTRSLLTLASVRNDQKDFSYDCFALAGEDLPTRYFTKEELQEKINLALSTASNDDGSDYFSMAYLAAYVMGFPHEKTDGPVWGEETGVVDYVENYNTEGFLNSLFSLGKLPTHLKYFVKDLIWNKDNKEYEF